MNKYFRLTNINVKIAKNGKSFVSGILEGKESSTPFKKFNATESDITELSNGVFIEGNVAENEYNGNLQYLLNSFKKMTVEQVIEADLVPKSRIPIEELELRFKRLLGQIKGGLQDIATEFFKKNKLFFSFPAAIGHHHNYIYGLLEHTVFVGENCLSMAEHYPTYINQDILLFSAIFHDVGKMSEYEQDEYGLLTDYTKEGHLIGHINIGYEIVKNLLDNNGYHEESHAENILHCILSHHGKKEWGSPVEPKTMEAIMLHHADYQDAQINAIESSFNKTDEETVKLHSNTFFK